MDQSLPSAQADNRSGPATTGPPSPLRESTRPRAPHRQSSAGVKRCWICMADQTEDEPTRTIVWRSPCKCNLAAHEDCLLDWVQDLEHPTDRRKPATKIECPQCKSEIKIARPKSYVLKAYQAVNRSFDRMVIPSLGVSVLGTIWAGAWIHGFQSVQFVFGQQEATRIFVEASKHRGWLGAYSLIPINLIFARTKFSDFVLPSGTLFLLATQITDKFEIDMTIWPPLPGTVFACLPAVRIAYNMAYQKAFNKLNKRLTEQIHPKFTEIGAIDPNNIANVQAEEDEEEEGEVVLQVEVNFGGPGPAEAVVMEEPVQMEDDDEHQEGEEDHENQPQDRQAAGIQANAQGNGILAARGEQIMESTSGLGATILGALAFPAVASGMGELLGFMLPKTWLSSANSMNGRPGLLRTKWGRSVVGGCLFVVLKDAITLYCRWRLAQSQQSRRIVDYDKKAKRYVL